jgi:anti-sigma-K factor RskA
MVGVLSLDSGFNIDRTFFEQEDVAKKVEAWARTFARMLFEDGVNPK